MKAQSVRNGGSSRGARAERATHSLLVASWSTGLVGGLRLGDTWRAWTSFPHHLAELGHGSRRKCVLVPYGGSRTADGALEVAAPWAGALNADAWVLYVRPWDTSRALVFEPSNHQVLEQAARQVPWSARVLDVGCGTLRLVTAARGNARVLVGPVKQEQLPPEHEYEYEYQYVPSSIGWPPSIDWLRRHRGACGAATRGPRDPRRHGVARRLRPTAAEVGGGADRRRPDPRRCDVPCTLDALARRHESVVGGADLVPELLTSTLEDDV